MDFGKKIPWCVRCDAEVFVVVGAEKDRLRYLLLKYVGVELKC